jgi:type IV pilus assembly protein PilX
MNLHRTYRAAKARRAARQRGVTIIIALVAMLILLFSGMALIRSFQSSAMLAGNLAFKRDLVNQGERALRLAWTQVLPGGLLSSEAVRQASDTAKNYSALRLSEAKNGVPLALLSDSAFAAVGVTSNDLVSDASGAKIRYVIDRLCSAVGAESDDNCSMAYQPSNVTGGSDFQPQNSAGVVQKSVYRVSVRISSVRGAVVFVQSTLTL